jgi:L,D-transpeptidase catalytic domain
MDMRWVLSSRRATRPPSRRSDLEQNPRADDALIILDISDQRGYLYARESAGTITLVKEFPIFIGDATKDAGARRTRIGLYDATQFHQNYQTEKVPSDFRGLGALTADFGAFAVHMEPDANGQWLHGTAAVWGELGVLFGVGPGSHGCIRCTNATVADLVHRIGTGTPILRIYSSRVDRGGVSRRVRNPYNYADIRTRIFRPEGPALTGPSDGLLGPTDAVSGGVSNVVDRLREIGISVEETPGLVPARTPDDGRNPLAHR